MLEPGHTLIGKYRILKIVGRGGMGAVYQAEAIQLGKIWAIKELAPPLQGDEEQRMYTSQFQQEARLLANLDHPGLPRIVDFFEEQGRHYLIMDFIPGRDLQTILAETGRALPHANVLGWLWEILDILAYLHDHTPPIIVRDIKPANIMLSEAGRIKLIDFGIAKTLSGDIRTATAIRGSGSPGYAPVEQYGTGGTDQRSDIYALGATAYCLLTCQIPPDSLQRMLNETPLLPISQLNPTVPEEIGRVIEKMLSVIPAMRYQTVHEVREALGWGNAPSPMAGKLPGLTSTPSAPSSSTANPLEEKQANIPTITSPRPSAGAAVMTAAAPPMLIHPTDSSELILIAEGDFWMGTAEGEGRADEYPGHQLALPAYYVGRYPVTFSQFNRFVNATDYHPEGWRKYYDADKAGHPVNHITLYDALAYCEWAGLRLLTEAEWEKAARGRDGRRYPWGDRWEVDRCNNWQTERRGALASMLPIVADRGPVPAGAFPDGASSYGVLDMVGNLLEWTASLHRPYPWQPHQNGMPPAEQLQEHHRYVLRGGAFNMSDSMDFRCMARYWSYPQNAGPTYGFRVAKSF